jgi:hypothetical protein
VSPADLTVPWSAATESSYENAVAEEILFEHLAGNRPPTDPKPVFVLGAPRTGSTILYQLLAHCCELPYFANLTNDHYSDTPIVGLAVQRSIADIGDIAFASSYGKVQGPFQPSEASAIMTRWCGGGHPSQRVSARVLPGLASHLRRTLVAAERMFGKPMLIKNAWNCFRVTSLSKILPRARFVWIRRDIRHAALSDLSARYVTKKSPLTWNSATPANVDNLRALPYWEQVVENQFEFNAALQTSLTRMAADRAMMIWYEDLCSEPESVIQMLAAFLRASVRSPDARLERAMERDRHYQLAAGDAERIFEYVRAQGNRHADMTHPAAASIPVTGSRP